MPRLKSRQRAVPNGFQFHQPETGWRPARFASFDSIVSQLIAHRTANPALAAKHKWATDRAGVENDVESFNANMCAAMGWTDYIVASVGEPPPPKSKPPSQEEQSLLAAAGEKSKKIWAGVRTLNDWLDSGEPPAPQELAEARATVCAACPKNGKGDFTRWFTQPASEAIRRQVSKVHERKLVTTAEVNVCEVCLCPMKVKVFTPLQFIKSHLTDAVLRELEQVPGCWIPTEVKA